MLSRWRRPLTLLLLWPVSIFVGDYVSSLISGPIWYLTKQSGATSLSLVFFRAYHQPQIAFVAGLLCGVIPLALAADLLRSSFGLFRQRQRLDLVRGEYWSRLLLQIWVYPTAAFAIRFAFFLPRESKSVLGNHAFGPGRLVYFFGDLAVQNGLDLAGNWVKDRVLLTLPMLFSVGFVTAVLLRRSLPQPPGEPGGDSIHTDTLGS